MLRAHKAFIFLFILGISGLAVCGCSNQGKTSLQGKVTYGGEPIALGVVTFTPVADGFRAIQTVKNGVFEVEAKNGVQPGDYNVLVEGYAEVPEDDPDQVAEKIFPDFATTITVKAGEPIEIDVPLAE
ncbi:MAG: carboxypeptidase-like regulatory domain-containing protein [Thermoguttaceae bacterium]